jgi:NADPH-dependent 2,4-dienoyl-CoA reductase/sulfur reductase-like enzyme
MTNLLIIGGSDAGISAALRAGEVDTTATVTVIVADSFPNYSICGLPFYLSGQVADWHSLAHRTVPEITRQGIDLLLNTTITRIDPAHQTVTTVISGDANGQEEALSDLDLSYTPPLGSPWDLVQMGAQDWGRSGARRK